MMNIQSSIFVVDEEIEHDKYLCITDAGQIVLMLPSA